MVICNYKKRDLKDSLQSSPMKTFCFLFQAQPFRVGRRSALHNHIYISRRNSSGLRIFILCLKIRVSLFLSLMSKRSLSRVTMQSALTSYAISRNLLSFGSLQRAIRFFGLTRMTELFTKRYVRVRISLLPLRSFVTFSLKRTS